MKIAVMQPYFFPYLGYFKLINSVDKFVFFDDVQYIRRGWVNRNKIRLEKPLWLTVPVIKCDRDTSINAIEIDQEWEKLTQTHLKTFDTTYGKKAKQNGFYQYYSSLSSHTNLCKLLCESIQFVSRNLNIKTEFVYSSSMPSEEKAQDRIIDICKKLKATEYYNLPGGVSLYDPTIFQNNSIKIEFINTDIFPKISVIETIFQGLIHEYANNL